MCFLFLKESIIFDANSGNSLYFDEENQQLICIHCPNDIFNITFKGPCINELKIFKIKNKGKVHSIKLSSDQSLLAIQRGKNTIEFVNVPLELKDSLLDEEYSRASQKESYGTLLGFVWCSKHDICFISSQGFELYTVLRQHKTLTLLSAYNCERVHWFQYLGHPYHILVLCTDNGVNVLRPFAIKIPITVRNLTNVEQTFLRALEALFCMNNHITAFQVCRLTIVCYQLTVKNGTFVKLPKIRHYLVTNPYLNLGQRDVTLTCVYDTPYVIIIGNRSIAPQTGTPTISPTFVYMYRVSVDLMTCELLHILILGSWATSGCIAINIVDNIIILHHQISQTSLCYDILLINRPMLLTNTGNNSVESCVNSTNSPYKFTLHRPIVEPVSIKHPDVFLMPNDRLDICQPCNSIGEYKLYSKDWSIFQPDIIVDTRAGQYWRLKLNLELVESMFEHKEIYVRFLLNRHLSYNALSTFLKKYLSHVVKDVDGISNYFKEVRAIFDALHQFNSKDKYPISDMFSEVWQELSTSSPTNIDLTKEIEYFPGSFYKSLLAIAFIYIHCNAIQNNHLEETFLLSLVNFMITNGFTTQLRYLLMSNSLPSFTTEVIKSSVFLRRLKTMHNCQM